MAEERLRGHRYGHRSVHTIRSRNTQVPFFPARGSSQMEARKPSNQAVDTRERQIPGSRAPRLRRVRLRSLAARAACGVLVAVAGLLTLPLQAQAQAQILVSNLGQATDSGHFSHRLRPSAGIHHGRQQRRLHADQCRNRHGGPCRRRGRVDRQHPFNQQQVCARQKARHPLETGLTVGRTCLRVHHPRYRSRGRHDVFRGDRQDRFRHQQSVHQQHELDQRGPREGIWLACSATAAETASPRAARGCQLLRSRRFVSTASTPGSATPASRSRTQAPPRTPATSCSTSRSRDPCRTR